MPRWNDTAARHDENNSSVEVEPGCTRDRRFTGFCLLSCLLSLSLALLPGSLHFHSWTSPALTNAMPWIHRGLSSGPCKPRRPLLTLQPNGYAKLPFACHRHHPPQTPSSAFDASRTQSCSGTRELAWLLLLCTRRGTCPVPSATATANVSYPPRRPPTLRWQMAARVFTP
jgi:hypothetical protein